ncbi:hypothetical protein NXV57_10735 [Bacteroides thetaiotaomicron]|nr:hypothetical protein [Bacteroides thetaiotaomicron]
MAEGDEFRILHRPAEWENPAMEFGIYSSIPESDPIADFVNSEPFTEKVTFLLAGE